MPSRLNAAALLESLGGRMSNRRAPSVLAVQSKSVCDIRAAERTPPVFRWGLSDAVIDACECAHYAFLYQFHVTQVQNNGEEIK